MMELSDSFVNAAAPSAAGVIRERAELDPSLRACMAAAAAAWPGVVVDPDAFAAHLRSKLPDHVPLAAALRTIRAADLYLAFACLQRDPAALVAFEDRWFPVLRRALAALRIDDGLRDEVQQNLRVDLFTPRDHQAPLIAGYAGRGDLGSWVRAVAVHAALAILRKARKSAPMVDDELVAFPSPGDDPEISYLKKRYAVEFRHALGEAMAALTVNERNLLRQYFLDRLTVDQLAAHHRVNRGTISRRLAAARARVRDGTYVRLAERLAVPPDDLRSILRAVKTELELSLVRHLQR